MSETPNKFENPDNCPILDRIPTLANIGKGAVFMAQLALETVHIVKNRPRMVEKKGYPAVDFVYGPDDF